MESVTLYKLSITLSLIIVEPGFFTIIGKHVASWTQRLKCCEERNGVFVGTRG